MTDQPQKMLLAFNVEQVHRLTGLSERQIRYWAKKEFYTPEYSNEDRRAFGRVYSFQDLVYLRTIALLRNTHKVPIKQLRRVHEWLDNHPSETWASLKFHVVGRELIFEDRDLKLWLSARCPSQAAIPIHLDAVISNARVDASALRDRSPEEIGSISRHRLVSHNAPVLAGTRIRTSAIWKFHEAGYTDQQILDQYPRLEPADIEAALQYERQQRGSIAS